MQQLVDEKGDTPQMIREVWEAGPKTDENRSRTKKQNAFYKAETAEKIRL